MKASSIQNQRVLAVDPYDQGLGFAVLEGPEELIDWGLKHAENRSGACYTEFLAKLIRRYDPDILITEDGARQGSSRHRETRLLLKRNRRLVSGISRAIAEAAKAMDRREPHHERLRCRLVRAHVLSPRKLLSADRSAVSTALPL